MRYRWPGWVGFAVVLTSCATAATSGDGPEATGAVEATPKLTPMLVLRSSGGFRQGDTVHVDLAGISEDGRVTFYWGATPQGSIRLDALGPSREGEMLVTARRLNVRRCRSSGCSVVGGVTRGEAVRVSDLQGRWYRFSGEDGTQGYLNVEHLQLAAAFQRNELNRIQRSTAAYYERELEGLSVAGQGSALSGYSVQLVEDELRFEFYTPYAEGQAVELICGAMRGIADFVLATMAQSPSQLFPSYSAGVYFESSEATRRDNVMVAGLAGGGGVYCTRAN